MRNSARFERKLINTNKRGLLSKSTFSKTKRHFRVLAGGFLLVIAVLWFSRPSHGGIDNGSLKDVKSRQEGTKKDSDHASLRNPQEEVGEEVGKKDSVEHSSDRWDDRKAFEMSLLHTVEEKEEDQRQMEIGLDHVDDEDLCDRSNYPAESELRSDQLTILINGFSESRLPLLQKNVQTYSSLAFVHSIYILWGNTSTPDDYLDKWALSGFGAPIYLVRQNSISLNDRFLPRKYIKTRLVAICDDDITVDGKSLGFALDVWRENEARIVGFFPRTHKYDPESRTWLYGRHYLSYSIVLTKFMILSTEYLFRYTCEMPAGVKEYVDEGMNCEDIAMNFLASSYSGTGPMLVEGKARDWGDLRNSAVQHFQDSELTVRNGNITDSWHFKESALSRKKNHLQDRGDCVTAFEKLWKGMKLHYSYAKASSNLENEIQCEKFGYLIDCDKSVSSKRDAARTVGESVISFSHRYAYATFLSSDQHIYASILLAQSLRSSGTIHDLVLLFDPSLCKTIPESHVLYEHYDEVVKVNRSAGGGDPWNVHGMLSAWLLLDYAKVVYLEVDSLVVVNIDHLFQLPEPAAAPQMFRPGKFSVALLVLAPSKETYDRLLQSLEKISAQHRSRGNLLNFFFDGWFQMPVQNRLPARYNLPIVFSKELTIPSWFDGNRAYEDLGPPMVVRYENANLMSKYHGSKSSLQSAWLGARLKLFELLQENALRPLESDDGISWGPNKLNSSHEITGLKWPPAPEVSQMGITAFASEMLAAREAFVTVLYGSQHPQFSLAGWAESFYHHHSFQSRPKTLLIVLSTLDPANYEEHRAYFDEVRVVEPFAVNERVVHDSFTLLHLWNQTDFNKLVYVADSSLFMANCNSLVDYPSFAAAPSLFPPDTFSIQVMSIQPDQKTYNLLKENLLSYEFPDHPVERFLNAHYSNWYQKSTRHRINPSYMVSAVFESHFQDNALPWKVLNFDLDWLPDEEANVSRLWKKALCDLKPGKRPDVLKSACEAV